MLVLIPSKHFLSNGYFWNIDFLRYLPDFPQLDNESDEVALIAFPLTVKNRDRDIVWLQCQDIDDLKYVHRIIDRNENR